MADSGPSNALWTPKEPEKSNLWKFMREISSRRGVELKTYNDMHRYSVDRYLDFWEDILHTCPVVYLGNYKQVLPPNARIDSTPSWFQGLTLNYAENILYTASRNSHSHGVCSKRHKEDDKIAVIQVRESSTSITPLTWSQLRRRVSIFATALRLQGVKEGDRVAAVAGNSIDTLCICLGTATLGGIFSTSSTDMGANGILERLRQVKPKWVFVEDAAVYNGKRTVLRKKMQEIVVGMKGVEGFQGLVSVPRDAGSPETVKGLQRVQELKAFLSEAEERAPDEPIFTRVGFSSGVAVVYSSGTTGPPKCIIHGVGGMIITGWKEGSIARGLGADTRVLQFTTTAWIMYLAAVQTLILGARLIMYDGSPFFPHASSFISLACSQGVTYFGVSPRYFSTIAAAGVVPRRIPGSEHLRMVTSTGMVLPQSLFKWFYGPTGFPSHVHLCNMSGGTDMAGAVLECSPLDPVWEVGGCQKASLGIDLRIFDSSVETVDDRNPPKGREVKKGQPGDLVIAKPFPNMPVGFWGDVGPKSGGPGPKYRSAYFGRFENVWTHGDFLYQDPRTNAFVLLGRADGVLNPSGVRFGSAEVYNVLEAAMGEEIEDSVCVGQRREGDIDERVLLFLKMAHGRKFNMGVVRRVKDVIAKGLSRRHVPAFVFEAGEIPTTVNNKKVELPVKRIVSGQRVIPSGTLANPKSLEYYYRFVDPEKVAKEQGLVERESKL